MQAGQFIIGMVNGAIEPYQTEGVEKLLSKEGIRYLYDLARNQPPGEYVNLWENDHAISKTIITIQSDGEGRKGTINHTVIIKIESLKDLMQHTNFLNLFDSAFNMKYEQLSNPLPEVTI